ncbi:MAG: hypothetical protein AAGA60_06560 [Cyanobacteria bacterium P01_E01_bin.42]
MKDFLLPLHIAYEAEKEKYRKRKSHFLQTARTLCDLGFFPKYRHLSDDALMLEIVCLSIDCDECPDRLFLEGKYQEMLEVDTERVLGCLPLYNWKNTLHYDNCESESDPDLEDLMRIDNEDDEDDLLLDEDDKERLEQDILLDKDCQEILGKDTLSNGDCEQPETLEESTSVDEDYAKKTEEQRSSDRKCYKRLEYRFETLLDSLGKLSRISRGKFVPENIVEIDNNCIQFDLEGKTHSLVLNELPYEPSVLAVQINPIIYKTGYQFELLSGRDISWEYDRDERYDLYIILLSEEEKQQLAEDKNSLFNTFLMFPHWRISFDIFYGDAGSDYSFKCLLSTLVKLSRIARGKFIFQDIIEIKKELIQFNLNRKTCRIQIDCYPDDILAISGKINPRIADTGYQFELFPSDASDRFVILVSEEEKHKLMEKTGWEFENCSERFN